MSTIRRVIRLAAALGIATAVVLGLTAAPAHAAPRPTTSENLTANLVIQKLGNGHSADCKITVGGNIAMTPARAKYLVDNGANARVEIWGDDLFFDNRQLKLSAQVFASTGANGLIILSVHTVNCYDKLNEDDLPADETDEIYAKVIVESVGFERKTKQSNTVSAVFGAGVRI